MMSDDKMEAKSFDVEAVLSQVHGRFPKMVGHKRDANIRMCSGIGQAGLNALVAKCCLAAR